jgi:hypothetical protein
LGIAVSATATAQAQDLLQQLPPDIQNAISAGGTYIAQGKPAFDLAAALASGQSVTAVQVVGAVGAVAGMINPLAGAAVVAMGTIAVEFQNLLQGVFQLLGLYDKPSPAAIFNGLLRTDETIPYIPIINPDGTLTYDPTWVHVDTWQQLQDFFFYGTKYHKAPSRYQFPGPGGGDQETHTLKENNLFGLLSLALSMNMTPLEQWANSVGVATGSWVGGDGQGGKNGVTYKPGDPTKIDPNSEDLSPSVMRRPVKAFRQVDPASFEGYFNKLLILNLQYWANGQPFLPVRSLLYGAATAWNKSHVGPFKLAGQCSPDHVVAGVQCWAPLDPENRNDPRVIAFNAGKTANAQNTNLVGSTWEGSTIELVLGPVGSFADPSTTLTDAAPLGINDGAYNGPVSTASTVTAVAIGVPAAAVVGSVVYSLAMGKAWDFALRNAWKGAKAILK